MIIEAERIEQAFQPLLGLPLSDMSRFSGWQRFEFGPQRPHANRRGDDVTWADHALHVACGWRIIGLEGIVVGSDDYDSATERQDEHARPFFKRLVDAPPLIETVRADMTGSVHIEMTDGFSVDIMPMGMIRETQWLFLLPDGALFAAVRPGDGR